MNASVNKSAKIEISRKSNVGLLPKYAVGGSSLEAMLA